MMTAFAIALLVSFQAYALSYLTKKLKMLETKVEELEEHPNKIRKLPAALEKIPWTAVTLEDGTEICTIERFVQYNCDAVDEYNKMMNLLGSVHASIYKKGTWLNTPSSNAASFRISWYKDLNHVPKAMNGQLEEIHEPSNTDY